MKDKEMETEIKNSVDLRVNQNDLVDMLMEDFKEKLEGSIESLEKRRDELDAERKNNIKEMEEVLKEQVKDPMVGQLKKILIANKIIYETSIDVSTMSRVIAEYPRVSIDDLRERYKNPVKIMKRKEKEESLKKVNLKTPDTYRLSITVQSGDLHYRTVYVKPVKDKDFEDLMKKQELILKEYVAVDKQLYELDKQLLQVEEGGVRFKSQFLRASLGKTKEGKQILDMVEQVKKGTKLLK